MTVAFSGLVGRFRFSPGIVFFKGITRGFSKLWITHGYSHVIPEVSVMNGIVLAGERVYDCWDYSSCLLIIIIK